MWWVDFYILCISICIFFVLYKSIRLFQSVYPKLIKKWQQRKHQTYFLEHESQLLHQFSTLLKAGHAPKQALHHLSKSHAGALFLEQFFNTPPRSQVMEFARLCFEISKTTGIALAPLFTELAAYSQTQKNMDEKLKTLTFPMKAQAVIAIAIPFFTLFCFWILDSNLVAQIFTTRTGWVGFSTALVLEGGAFLWIKKILTS